MDEDRIDRSVIDDRTLLKYIQVKAKQHKVHVVAVRELPDPFYAASLDCQCEEKSCNLLKTGYIFNTDDEALEFGNDWLRELCARRLT